MIKTVINKVIRGLKLALAGAIALLFLYSGDDRPNQLEQVMQRGSMTLLTRNGASSYYLGSDGPTGPEYTLVSDFADFLGVQLDVESTVAFNEMSGLLNRRQGELIAANLARTPDRELLYNFGPDYLETATVVVYRRGQPRPRTMEDLVGLKIMVIAGSSYEEALTEARKDIPELEWEPRNDVGMEELLLAVSDKAIDATLVDTIIFHLNGHYYPGIAEGFTLPGSLPLAWAFAAGPDDSLVQQSRIFMSQAESDGRLAATHDAFYLPENRLTRVSMFQFMQQVRQRLPDLRALFQDVARTHDMDWRFLAAIGYQESHWDPEATSATGVRGLMMLTRRTANQLGVTDRLSPEQSVEGGARYYLQLRNRLPKRITEPDRSWMALAAYNLGLGHLEDVRVLTEKQGGNADSWEDVSQHLELLSKEKWHRQTRYGYARGYEAKQYVANIQSYYEILIWMDTRDHPLLTVQL